MKLYSFKAKVWLWPGIGGWHFVNLPDKVAKVIRKNSGKGMIKVLCRVKKAKWKTALFPNRNPKGEFGYLLSIKKSVRKSEGVLEGDTVKLSFTLEK